MEKKEPSFTVGGNVNWYNQYRESTEVPLKTKKLLYDPASPLLGIYLENINYDMKSYTSVFTAALLTIARRKGKI